MADNNTRKDDEPAKWPWGAEFALALCAMVLAALFLIGLPYVVTIAVDGANVPESPGAAKAWNAIVPSLLGLTTMTISGIFLFMTLRIDRGAKAEARDAAEDKVKEIIESQVKTQLDKLLEEKMEAAIKQIKDRATSSNSIIDVRFVAFDQRLKERFEDADTRIRERIADADERSSERVKAADKRLSDWIADAENRIAQTRSGVQERMERPVRDSQ